MVITEATGLEQIAEAYVKNVWFGKREASCVQIPVKNMQKRPVITKASQPSLKFVTSANVRGMESTPTAIVYEATT